MVEKNFASGLTYQSKYPFNLSLVALLELTLHHPLPLRWRQHSIVSNQCNGERPPLQRPGVLAIVTFLSNGRTQRGPPARLNNLSSYSPG